MWDDIVERALAHGDRGATVEVTQTINGDPCLSDGEGWLIADDLIDVGEWR